MINIFKNLFYALLIAALFLGCKSTGDNKAADTKTTTTTKSEPVNVNNNTELRVLYEGKFMAYMDNDITITKDVADPAGGPDKVLKIVSTNSNALPIYTFSLPSGKTFADIKSFTYDAYTTNKDLGLKSRIYYVNPKKFAGSRLPSGDANLLINPEEIKGTGSWVSYEIKKSDCTYSVDGTVQIKLVPADSYLFEMAIGLRHGGGSFEWFIKNVSVKF